MQEIWSYVSHLKVFKNSYAQFQFKYLNNYKVYFNYLYYPFIFPYCYVSHIERIQNGGFKEKLQANVVKANAFTRRDKSLLHFKSNESALIY